VAAVKLGRFTYLLTIAIIQLLNESVRMIKFSKMHGLGNDFAVINAVNQQLDASQLPVKLLAHRHLGIGFDQLLIIKASKKADVFCQIINSDGSEAEQCGNGLRCVARYLHDNGIAKSDVISIETLGGVYNTKILDAYNVQVAMGSPSFQGPSATDIHHLEIEHNLSKIPLTLLSMGNPHAVMEVNSLANFPVSEVGHLISTHASFSQITNVGFMEIINRDHIRLRTYERGTGETFACGSNACAAVVAGIINHSLAEKVTVELAFGNLWIEWTDKEKPVLLTGPAMHIFEGSIQNTPNSR
jgi:diaminopimelate epimerase